MGAQGAQRPNAAAAVAAGGAADARDPLAEVGERSRAAAGGAARRGIIRRSFCTAIFRPYMDPPYKRAWARRNDRAAIVQAELEIGYHKVASHRHLLAAG